MSGTRLAIRSDIPRLAELLGELFSQEREFAPDRTAQTRGLALLFDRGDSARIVVAEAAGDVVGMGVLHYSVSTYLGAKVAMLEDVIVADSLRGKGVGKRLMAAIIAQARFDGAQRLTLLTDNDNLSARHFYESFGFTRSTMLPYRLMLPTTLTV
ncbi:MAG: GNAT family N-acetyltransferase [Hyphomicrobium sp.]|nr:GNAT family N-acetyltransferase [Hyphomicrobium sp.]